MSALVTGGQSLARVLAAIEGFQVTFNEWPSAVRVAPGYLDHLRSTVLTSEAFADISGKVRFIADDGATVIAENDGGQSYDFGKLGFSKTKPSIRARVWLGLDDL